MALGPSLYISLHNSHKSPGKLLCMPNIKVYLRLRRILKQTPRREYEDHAPNKAVLVSFLYFSSPKFVMK